MSEIQCHNCGAKTNTAVAQWLNPRRKDGKANFCYLSWLNGKWVKGCAYSRADIFIRPRIDDMLKNKPLKISKPEIGESDEGE